MTLVRFEWNCFPSKEGKLIYAVDGAVRRYDVRGAYGRRQSREEIDLMDDLVLHLSAGIRPGHRMTQGVRMPPSPIAEL